MTVTTATEALARCAFPAPAADMAEAYTRRDALAWTGIAACLTRLALALHSGKVNFGDRMSLRGEYDNYNYNWDDLAAAGSRRELTAAWQPIREHLVELAALPDGDGDPQLRGFTVAQVIRAAAAVTGDPW